MKRSTTLYLVLPWLALSPLVAPAQMLLNGGFEDSNANVCLLNLVNSQFNFAVANVNSFGNTPNVGSTGEADVLVDGCLLGPFSGERAVMIACEATTTDRLAFTLDQPLLAGIPYRLSLRAAAWTQFNPVVHAIQFGVSNSNNSFGTAVGTVDPESMTWNAYEVHFTLEENAAYLTVQVVLDGVNGAVVIDDLVLETTTSVPDAWTAQPSFLRSTVLEADLDYISSTAGELAVMDMAGRTLRRFPVNGPGSWPVADLPSGGYLVQLTSDGQRQVMRVVKP